MYIFVQHFCVWTRETCIPNMKHDFLNDFSEHLHFPPENFPELLLKNMALHSFKVFQSTVVCLWVVSLDLPIQVHLISSH